MTKERKRGKGKGGEKWEGNELMNEWVLNWCTK